MTMGPGKYDDVCTMVRKHVGIKDSGGGAVIALRDEFARREKK